MNLKLIPALLLAASLVALGGERAPSDPANASASTSTPAGTARNEALERVLRPKPENPGVSIGKSGYSVQGALVEGLKRQRPAAERSRREKWLGLPVVRLLVPQSEPPPAASRRYFAWGESSRPWTAIAAGAGPAAAPGNPVTHEARTSLICVGR